MLQRTQADSLQETYYMTGCQPLTGNDKTGYTILYTAYNEIHRKQATIHR